LRPSTVSAETQFEAIAVKKQTGNWYELDTN